MGTKKKPIDYGLDYGPQGKNLTVSPPKPKKGSKQPRKPKVTDPTLADIMGFAANGRAPGVGRTRPLSQAASIRKILDIAPEGRISLDKSGNPPPAFASKGWLQSLIAELDGPVQQLDQGAYLAPFDQADQNLAGAYESARGAINQQPASLRTAFAQMDQSALANQQAIQQGIAQRLAQVQAQQGAQAGAVNADLAAQGVSTAPVQQQAALQQAALAGQNVNQAAVVANQAAAQQAAGDRREGDTNVLIGGALGQLESNRVAASGRIGAGRAAAMQRFSEMQMARQDALRERKLSALDKVREIEQYTSPAEEVRAQLAANPASPTLALAAGMLKDFESGDDDLDTALANLQDPDTKKKLRSQGVDPNRLASVLRSAYDNSAKKRQRTLDQVRGGG